MNTYREIETYTYPKVTMWCPLVLLFNVGDSKVKLWSAAKSRYKNVNWTVLVLIMCNPHCKFTGQNVICVPNKTA